MRTPVLLTLVLFFSGTAGAVGKIECSLQSEKKVVSVALSSENYAVEISEGLSVGDHNYSFTVEYYADTPGEHGVSVVIEENNQVQDEVGSLTCLLSGENSNKCEKEITSIEGAKLQLSCSLKK